MPTEQVQLGFHTLSDIDDGRIAALLLKQLKSVANDCIDRPTDERARKLILEFSCVPVLDVDTRECERVDLQVQCKTRVPNYQSKIYQMKPTKGGFLFNRDFPDAIAQLPLPGMSRADDDLDD